MHTIDPGTIECMLALALDALHASGIECVIEGDTPFRCVVGEPVPGIDPVQTEQAAVFVLPTPNDIAVVLHPITGVSGESGWIAAVRPADQPFDDASLVTAAGVAQLIEDQTDRSLEQAQLAELGAVLRKNQDQLRSAHDRLEVSNGELEQFAYIAAHELVSPLRAVAIYAELLDTLASNLGGGTTDSPKLDPDAGDSPIGAAAAAIRTGVGQMQEHVQQLLELTRVESDPTPFAPADLTQVAQRAIDTQSADIAAVGGSIELGSLSTVLGQPVHLQSVFANLISNAVRYRSPDRPIQVTISDASTNEATVIVVTDNGIGVAAEDRQRVFAMFERGVTQQPGFGIGLSLTRRILERHGAEISLDAAPSHGCTFTLRFALPVTAG